MKRNKCVYEYRLPESEGGHTYYVGQGNYSRPYKPHPYRGHKRNPCIKPKDKNQIVIIKDNLTEQEAKDLEIKLIAKHGRIDLGEGYLINKTDGGEGTNGIIVSEETRRKLSEANKGNTHTEETRRKLSEAAKGKIFTEETRRKLSELKKGKNNPNFGKSFTEETKRKMSEAAKGKIFTEDHRRKLSEASKNRPFVKCIHCGKSSQQPANINRWHNDNCKHKESVNLFDL